MESYMESIILIGVGGTFFLILVSGIVFSRLYKRSTKEVSFVRTGTGGQKVVVDGGCLVLPVLHDILSVNMNTLRLEVQRSGGNSLITKDRLRVDVTAEFYVRVKPTEESIACAAQTLGSKTLHPDQLKALIEAKFVDTLRSVASSMEMEELHEKRADFVQRVQQGVSDDLLKNGLELESVSLTGLDQTDVKHFDPQNAFDAEGLLILTRAIETRNKERNTIEQDNKIAIEQKDLESEKKHLAIKQESELAQIEQEKAVSVRRAAMDAEVKQEGMDRERDVQELEITNARLVMLAEISSKEESDAKRIKSDLLIGESKIAKAKALEKSEILRSQAIELANQDKQSAIADRSEKLSRAEAKADEARALAVEAEERVITVRETEIAERDKKLGLVEAAQGAEVEAVALKISAQAAKEAARDDGEALLIQARSFAQDAEIRAKGEKVAADLEIQVSEARYLVDAAGETLLNEARNSLSEAQVAMMLREKLLDTLPSVIRESAKPMENIDDIKIIQVEGLGGGSSAGSGEEPATSLSDQVVNSAMRYRAQAPLVDSLLQEVGISGGDINGLTKILGGKGNE